MKGGGQDRIPRLIAKEASPLVDAKHDKAMLDVLAFVIANGPTTIYRAAKELPYSISLTYKKANRMLEDGLIRKVQVPAHGAHRAVYEPTVKGILTCMVYGCMDEQFLTEKLLDRWGLNWLDPRKLLPIFRVLPYVIKPSDVTMLEDLRLLSMAILNEGKRLDELGRDVASGARDIALRIVIGELFNMLVNCKAEATEGPVDETGLVVGTEDFLVNVDPVKRTVFVYNCRRCGSSCSMVSFSVDSSKCRYLSDIYKRISFVFSTEQATSEKKA